MLRFVSFIVAASLGTAASAQPVPATLACGGSEPFWSLALGPGKARLDAPEPALLKGGSDFSGKATPIANQRPGTIVWRGRATGGASELVAVITRQACPAPRGEDDPFRVFLSLPDGTALAGCCR
ncbi:MAG: hypothetical protein EXR12_08995 [Rhodospirillaceae bacterium]|nr:hypothetical protein [Rhodospirillaceae bacterium]